MHLRNVGFQRNQPKEGEGLSRTRIPGRGHLGHSSGWKDTEGNHTPLPLTFQFKTNLKPEDWKDMDQFLQLQQLLKDLFQWSMDNKRFNLASHWAELGETCQKICPKEIDFNDLMVITKGWNITRQFKLLDVRANRIRENQATIQAIEEQLTQTGHTQISGQQSPFFTIPQSFQEKKKIQGQKQDHLQPEEDRVRPYYPEAVGFSERNAQEPEVVVNNSRISSPLNRNITNTQIEHNVVTPESNLNSDALWLQMSQYSEQTQNGFAELAASHERMKILTASMDETVKHLQKGHAQLRKASEETNKRFKDKPRERVAKAAKKKNSCHHFGSTDHCVNNCPKAEKKVYAIEKVPEEESPTENSDSDSMVDAIREQSDEEKDPREELLVEYQEETPLEIQDIQLEAGMPQEIANKNLCKHTQEEKEFLVTPTKGMAYIHGTATKMTVCIDNAQHPLIIHSGAHFSIVATKYLDNHFPNWEKTLLPTKAKNFKGVSGKMTSIGTITKEIIIPHRKGNIRLIPEFLVLDDSHIQGKNRHITLGTNKEKKFSLDIYQISAQDPLEELLNELREVQFSTTHTSKQNLSLLKMLRKNRPEFAVGEEPLGKIRGHDIELYLDVEIPYPPILRRTHYPEILETRKEI
ncbi:hypothetical protein O181_086593 [Austropuccinia psidii MF-1]|uniref:Uncharacterized protein n=1 Tax=Austropuccinia psidii MF-1 TaxID=1389203 RepID=A0A9Q3IMB8_9BASI|nr:hypothetical protein [Austropuccinia psidii MF-1]